MVSAPAVDGWRRRLREAVELWVESCQERNTLHQALAELGWEAVPAGERLRVELRFLT